MSSIVTVITGEINSGKTTKLKELYDKNKKGDGFILTKIFYNDYYIGQYIRCLKDNSGTLFSLKKSALLNNCIKSDFKIYYVYKDFLFSESGMQFFISKMSHIIQKGISPVYIDEIGPLELSGYGFSDYFYKILEDSSKKLIITVRNSCLSEITDKFNFCPEEIIPI